MKFYNRKKWHEYRAKCIRNADGVCQRCGEGVKDGKTLQVHHPKYIKGRKPWEYPMEHCEVLCRGCHAEEHGKILPRSGWEILSSDLEDNEPSEPTECANCGREIRWHVTVYHPSWGEAIVGTECGETLSLGPEIAAMKSYRRRMKAFVASSRWKATPKGQSITQAGYRILVFRGKGDYQIKIGDDWGKCQFETLDKAKQRVFAVVEQRKRNHTKGFPPTPFD